MRSLRQGQRRSGRAWSGTPHRVDEETPLVAPKDPCSTPKQVFRKRQIAAGTFTDRKPFNRAKWLHEQYLLKKKYPEVDFDAPWRAGAKSVRSLAMWKKRRAKAESGT